MRAASSSTTVFARLRASARAGRPFSPTPVPTRVDASARISKADLGIYATIDEFACLTGLCPSMLDELMIEGALTHLRISDKGPCVHVEKGLRDLERLERSPSTKSAQPFSSINDDTA